MILLTRKADFAAAHFYFNPAWSEEENRRVFGKCANRHGHGHNYTLEVTVRGEVDPTSGFVVDLKELKDIMALSIWERLDGRIPGARLHRVRVYEAADLFADVYGEGS